MANISTSKVSFQELKTRVGIDDVAYALGYRLDRKAGVGRYFEMVLGDGHDKRDTIIIRNTSNKAAQTFFRRDGSKGDVVTFVRENLNAFNTTGNNDWQKITNILSGFANMPVQEYRSDLEYISASRGDKPFNPERYDVQDVKLDKIHKLFFQRGFDAETVRIFSPFVKLISDRHNRNFSGFNIGFPYTSLCQDGIAGYEIRGFGGFKSKASGTNSSSAAWVADFSHGNQSMVTNVFFFESAFDAMAFHQMNRARLGNDVALVSLGGTFSESQVLGVIDRFPNARIVDCFDNDLAGRVNGLRLISVAERIPMKIQKTEEGLNVTAKDKTFLLELKRPLHIEIGQHISIKQKLGQWLPPGEFKDWNDCLLGKTIEPVISPTKRDRDANLAQRRTSLKL